MAATKLFNSEMITVDYQAPIYSRPIRQNFKTLQNHYNELYDRVTTLATATPSGSEVTDARDNASVLKDRLQYASRGQSNIVIDGLTVSAQSSPDMTVQVSAGVAVVDGVVAYKSSSTNTGTITAPTNSRYDIICINNNNSIEILNGNDSTTPYLPAVSITDRPLAVIKLTSSTTSITSSEIFVNKTQGCYMKDKTDTVQWYFSPADAIAAASDGAYIWIGGGEWWEEMDISGLNDITIEMLPSTKMYRRNNAQYILKSINTVGNETSGNKIIGGKFYGNGQAGAYELARFEYTDKFVWKETVCDGNTSSTADFKNYYAANCDKFLIDSVLTLDGSDNVTELENDVSNCFDYNIIGYDRITVGGRDLYRQMLRYSEKSRRSKL